MTTSTLADIGRDPRVEAWLDAAGVTWIYEPMLELDRIDMKRSLQNQARPGEALIEDNVELCIKGFLDHAVMPPIVCRRTSARAKLVITDGNHRATAAHDPRVALSALPGYIWEGTDEVALVLAYTANLTHGAQLSRPQRILQAVHLVEAGMSARDAARQMGVDEVGVSNQRLLNRAAARATSMKVTKWDEIPQGQRLDLARLDDDAVFKEAAVMVAETGLTATDTKDLIRRVKGAKSETARLEVIADERDVRRKDIQQRFGGKISAGRGKRQTEFDRLRIVLASLQSIDTVDVDESAPGPDARKRLRADLKVATSKLIEIDKAVK